jgi:hypothetical protein
MMPRIFLRRPLILTDNENELSIFVRNALRWVVISRTEKIWTESHASTCFYILSSLLAAAPRQSNYSLSLSFCRSTTHTDDDRLPQPACSSSTACTSSSSGSDLLRQRDLLNLAARPPLRQRYRFFTLAVRPLLSSGIASSTRRCVLNPAAV